MINMKVKTAIMHIVIMLRMENGKSLMFKQTKSHLQNTMFVAFSMEMKMKRHMKIFLQK